MLPGVGGEKATGYLCACAWGTLLRGLRRSLSWHWWSRSNSGTTAFEFTRYCFTKATVRLSCPVCDILKPLWSWTASMTLIADTSVYASACQQLVCFSLQTARVFLAVKFLIASKREKLFCLWPWTACMLLIVNAVFSSYPEHYQLYTLLALNNFVGAPGYQRRICFSL